MTRLTVAIKNQMINKALIVAGINKELKSLIERRALLANSIRINSLGGEDNITKIKKHLKKISSLTESDLIKNVSGRFSSFSHSDFELNNINLGGM